ncbi:MAG: HEAT repeat domain-containing protein, partial [Planctomycetota bacterium]
RQAAQFALVDRQAQAELIAAAKQTAANATLARIHAIWGLGQLLAKNPVAGNNQAAGAVTAQSAVTASGPASAVIIGLLADEDAEVRAQAAKVAGDRRLSAAAPALIERLQDRSERVRYFAAISLGKTAGAESVRPLVELLAANNDQDPALRHAAIYGLAQVGGYRGWEPESTAGIADSATNTAANAGSLKVDGARNVERETITAQLRHPSAAARLGLAVVLRRLGMSDVAKLLDDADPRVVVEAARGIHDEPIAGAMPALAALAGRELSNDALARRVLNANYRLGTAAQAQAIAQVAARASTPEPMKLEAIEMLASWDKPSPKDRVLNMWRPLAERSRQPAVDAFRAVLPTLVARADKAGAEAAKRAAGLGIQEVGPMLRGLVADLNQPAGSRAEALRALATLKDAQLLPVTRSAVEDQQPAVRAVARDLLAQLQPQEVLPLLRAAAQSDSMIERQAAWTTLGGVSGADVDELFTKGLDQLLAGQTPVDSRLELLTAAGLRKNDAVQSRLKQYLSRRPADDPLAAYAETLAGGDPERGARIFFERAQVSCVRCHTVQGRGGDVGPELTKIGGEKNAAYLLESIVLPNKTIAKNFESVLVVDDQGKVTSGVIKAEDAQTLQLVTAEGGLVKIDKSAIEERRAAKSPMPEDLIKQLTSYELRDLIAYLSSLR